MRKLVYLSTIALLVWASSLIAEKLGSTTIQIKGDPCEDCISQIEKTVVKVEGVKTIKICPKSKKAKIEYDESKTDVKKLEAAIAAVGFDAGDTKAKNPHKCSEPNGEKKATDCCNAENNSDCGACEKTTEEKDK